jgi:hypothetical protein
MEKSKYIRKENISKIPIDGASDKAVIVEVLSDYPSRDPIFQVTEDELHSSKKGRVLVYYSGLKPFIKMLQSVDEIPLIPAKSDHFSMPHLYLHKSILDDSTGVIYEFMITKEHTGDGFIRETTIHMTFKDKSVGSVVFPWHITSFVLREIKAMSKLVKRSIPY